MSTVDASKRSNKIASKLRGRVKWFNHAKGFGYITPEDGTHDILLDEAECDEDDIRLKGVFHEGQPVEFNVRSNHRGRPVAMNVHRIADDTNDVDPTMPRRHG